MKTETNTVESCLLATRQYNHLVIRVTLFWSEQNLSQLFSCLKKPLQLTDWMSVVLVTTCDKCWPLFHFWRHHLWTKLLHVYSNSAKGKDLSNDTQMGWMGQLRVKFAQGCWSKISLSHTWVPHGWEFPLLLIHSKEFFNWKQA